jgi:hypothetical protein
MPGEPRFSYSAERTIKTTIEIFLHHGSLVIFSETSPKAGRLKF